MAVDLPKAVRNPISLTGVAIATAGALVFLVLLALELGGQFTNPYAGLLVFVAAPAVFVIGLLIIPIGAMRQRRRIAAGLATTSGRSSICGCRARAASSSAWR